MLLLTTNADVTTMICIHTVKSKCIPTHMSAASECWNEELGGCNSIGTEDDMIESDLRPQMVLEDVKYSSPF